MGGGVSERRDSLENAGNGRARGTSDQRPPGSKLNGHKHGLCMWYLAGALKLTNRNKEVFICRDRSVVLAALNTVPLGVVRSLVTDKDFMSCTNEGIKDRLRKAVEDQSDRFAK